MIRTLLTTTALAALLTSGAIAQNATESRLLTEGYSIVDTDGLASKLIGFPVYSAATDDADKLGEINDMVIGQDGSVSAVIIGVGGFLGIGEKNVAVEYDKLQWTVASDNTERLVLETTREALNAAPGVEMEDDEPADTAAAPADPNAPANNAMAPATDTAMTPADPNAPADNAAAPADTAMAPADPNAPADNAAAPADTAMAPADPNAPADNATAPATDVAAAPAEPVDATETGAIAPNDTATAPLAPFDPSAYQEFDESALTAEELIGTQVYGVNNEHIGPIGDVLLSEDGKSIDAIIIDFGGFLGIGVKEVAVGFENLDFRADGNNNRVLVLNLTREQMDQATAFNRDTYANEREQQRYVVSSM